MVRKYLAVYLLVATLQFFRVEDMEAENHSEMLVLIYQATWYYIPQDHKLTNSCENLKTFLFLWC
jgi:hypothetical protein